MLSSTVYLPLQIILVRFRLLLPLMLLLLAPSVIVVRSNDADLSSGIIYFLPARSQWHSQGLEVAWAQEGLGTEVLHRGPGRGLGRSPQKPDMHIVYNLQWTNAFS